MNDVNVMYNEYCRRLCIWFDEGFPIRKKRAKPVDGDKSYIDEHMKSLFKENLKTLQAVQKETFNVIR